jgi:hypothetical protein
MHQMTVWFRFIILVLSFFSTIPFAYAYFGTGSQPSAPSSATQHAAPELPAVMSADQFSSLVQSLKQQTQNSLSTQATEAMNKPLPTQSTEGAATPSHPSTISQQSTSPATATPTPSQPQSQPYTGFGAGQSNTPAPSQPTKPAGNSGGSGNWNIQY